MAGTPIAVALVPPVCVMGLMLSRPDLTSAQGPALLYAANLLGILIGGITVLAICEPHFRDQLWRRRRSRLPVLLALGLAVLVGQKLYGRYELKLNRGVAQKQIESEIRYFLKNETLTLGANDSVELEKVVFDWPDCWEQNQAPSFQVVLRSLDPKLPSYKQVLNIQDTINSRLSGQFPGLELQMQIQHINVSMVEGSEVNLEVDLEQIFNDADTSLAPAKVLEDEPKDQAEDSALAEICSKPDC